LINLICQQCGKLLSFVDEQVGKYSYCSACDFPILVARPSFFASRTVRIVLVLLTAIIVTVIVVMLVYPEAQEPFKEFWKVLKGKFKPPRRG